MTVGEMTVAEMIRFCESWDCHVCPLNLDRPFWGEEDGLCVGVCALRLPKRWTRTRLDEELPGETLEEAMAALRAKYADWGEDEPWD